ncbi:PREDICTED: integrator complex subunit 11 homolog isoform X2 [Trachymyrmex cornetzi]|uniref:integrator complex subunit 11 homolog isoform X2 n=1 Tax=Trachymyrmex cornetzi TaxID=471704 RepID=UPI00084F0E8F|nr:PREDICTED: integrator complex subunit 11 homolog isoform X2 [Trachymyrmex cornetzi]
MDKIIRDVQINKKPLISQSSNNSNHSYYKTHQLVAIKTKNNEETNNNNDIIDYKNISLSMTGEISSGFVHRNNLTKKQTTNVTFVEDTENADDEEFISNMKTIIDKNYKMQDKENFSIRDLQSKSYLSRKKKCAFSDEDQNLMKRFKKTIDERKASCTEASQKLQQPEHAVISVSNHNCLTTYTTPQIIPFMKYNDSDMSSSNSNELIFDLASKIQNNDGLMGEISGNVKTITEIEIEQRVYNEMLYFTPPQKDNFECYS